MKKILTAFPMLALLAACGADGDPITPTANVNVGVGTSGAHASANVGLQKGPWNVSLGRLF